MSGSFSHRTAQGPVSLPPDRALGVCVAIPKPGPVWAATRRLALRKLVPICGGEPIR
jgi:hypothetical protein